MYHDDIQLWCVACGIVGALESTMCHAWIYSIRALPADIYVCALGSAMRSMRTYSVSCAARGIVGALEFAMCSMMTYSVSCAARGIVGALEFAMCSMRTCCVVACGIFGALEFAMCSMRTCCVVACGIVGALESAMCSMRTYNIYCVACGIVGDLESAMSSLRTYIVSFYLSLRRSPSLIDRKKTTDMSESVTRIPSMGHLGRIYLHLY